MRKSQQKNTRKRTAIRKSLYQSINQPNIVLFKDTLNEIHIGEGFDISHKVC